MNSSMNIHLEILSSVNTFSTFLFLFLGCPLVTGLKIFSAHRRGDRIKRDRSKEWGMHETKALDCSPVLKF